MKTAKLLGTRLFNLAGFLGVSAMLLLILWLAGAIGASAQAFKTLASFNGIDGAGPGYVYLVQGPDGNLYGTTQAGGASGNGTVFRITAGGTLTTLHSFPGGTDGSSPCAGLALATDGNFYGTTSGGGTSNDGTVFRITAGGTLTTLHSFTGSDGADPEARLVQATDGNLYGTTNGGGTSNDGTVFQITLTGTLTTLHSFDGTDGARPLGGVIQATDGNFYGTTVYGGFSNPAFCGNVGCGTVFKITPAGTLTTLHSFTVTDGFLPYAGLVQATDGNFYGTTRTRLTGCISMCGTVFRITPAGSLSVVHDFTGWDGSHPTAGLIQATDGNFYGTTFDGTTGLGPGFGNVFEMTLSGGLTKLHFFDGTDGSGPMGGLFQASDGNLYGTTSSGGTSNDGTVYSLPKGSARGDFAVTVDPTTVTINSPGAQATTVVTVTPSDGFSQTITFTGASCAGLPEGGTCSFNPQSVTPSGGPASTTLTIATTAPSAAIRPGEFGGANAMLSVLAVPGLLVLGVANRRKSRSGWRAARIVLSMVLVGSVLSALNACVGTSSGKHGGSGGGGTEPGTYTVTVTATASSVSHETTITLVVQ